MPEARPFDAAKYRDDPRAVTKYLNDALLTGDPVLIIKAIDDMVRAQGVTSLRKRLGCVVITFTERLMGNRVLRSIRS